MKNLICLSALALLTFSNYAFSQSSNYKHNGYQILHTDKNTKHHSQLNKPSLAQKENYKTNNFKHEQYISDLNKKESRSINQNPLAMKEHYKVQFKPSENVVIANRQDTSKLIADKRESISK